jgi:hypothetical protein
MLQILGDATKSEHKAIVKLRQLILEAWSNMENSNSYRIWLTVIDEAIIEHNIKIQTVPLNLKEVKADKSLWQPLQRYQIRELAIVVGPKYVEDTND